MARGPAWFVVWRQQRLSLCLPRGSFGRHGRGEQKARIIGLFWFRFPGLAFASSQLLVDLRLQRSAPGDGAEMESIGASTEAQRLPERATPTESVLMRQARRRGRHGVEPPAFLRLETEP